MFQLGGSRSVCKADTGSTCAGEARTLVSMKNPVPSAATAATEPGPWARIPARNVWQNGDAK
jgi:hypothetical protein